MIRTKRRWQSDIFLRKVRCLSVFVSLGDCKIQSHHVHDKGPNTPPSHPPIHYQYDYIHPYKTGSQVKSLPTVHLLQSNSHGALPESSSHLVRAVCSVRLTSEVKPAPQQPNHHLGIIQSVRFTPRHCLASPAPWPAPGSHDNLLATLPLYNLQRSMPGISPIQG